MSGAQRERQAVTEIRVDFIDRAVCDHHSAVNSEETGRIERFCQLVERVVDEHFLVGIGHEETVTVVGEEIGDLANFDRKHFLPLFYKKTLPVLDGRCFFEIFQQLTDACQRMIGGRLDLHFFIFLQCPLKIVAVHGFQKVIDAVVFECL
ncbi:hypothetical protein D3C87_1338360 [compost metagenome]